MTHIAYDKSSTIMVHVRQYEPRDQDQECIN